MITDMERTSEEFKSAAVAIDLAIGHALGNLDAAGLAENGIGSVRIQVTQSPDKKSTATLFYMKVADRWHQTTRLDATRAIVKERAAHATL